MAPKEPNPNRTYLGQTTDINEVISSLMNLLYYINIHDPAHGSNCSMGKKESFFSS